MTDRRDDQRLESEAVEALYRQHGEDLRAFLTGILRDSDRAAEALQIVFRKALERGQSATENIRGWLFRVAYNEAMLVKRVESREQRLNRKAVANREAVLPVPEEADFGALRAERVETVRVAINQLSDEQRRVVRMRIYDEKKFAVIAEELDLPLGTVLTRMRLAMQKLKRALDEEE